MLHRLTALARRALLLGAVLLSLATLACGSDPERADQIPADRKACFEACWDLEHKLPYETYVSSSSATIVARAWDGRSAYYQVLAPHKRPDGQRAFGLVTGELTWRDPQGEWVWLTNHHLVTVGEAPLKAKGAEIVSALIGAAAWPDDEHALAWPEDNAVGVSGGSNDDR